MSQRDFTISKNAILAAYESSLLAINLQNGKTFVIDRLSDGGVDNPVLSGLEDFYPISALKQEIAKIEPGNEFTINLGDWDVIPYFKQRNEKYVESYRDLTLYVVE